MTSDIEIVREWMAERVVGQGDAPYLAALDRIEAESNRQADSAQQWRDACLEVQVERDRLREAIGDYFNNADDSGLWALVMEVPEGSSDE